MGRETARLTGVNGPVVTSVFSRKGDRFYAATDMSKNIYVWNLEK
jgi:hypothetical protein